MIQRGPLHNKERMKMERELEQTAETLRPFFHKLMLNFQEHKLEKNQLEETSKKKTGKKT
jgi:hypothetical protein